MPSISTEEQALHQGHPLADLARTACEVDLTDANDRAAWLRGTRLVADMLSQPTGVTRDMFALDAHRDGTPQANVVLALLERAAADGSACVAGLCAALSDALMVDGVAPTSRSIIAGANSRLRFEARSGRRGSARHGQ